MHDGQRTVTSSELDISSPLINAYVRYQETLILALLGGLFDTKFQNPASSRRILFSYVHYSYPLYHGGTAWSCVSEEATIAQCDRTPVCLLLAITRLEQPATASENSRTTIC